MTNDRPRITTRISSRALRYVLLENSQSQGVCYHIKRSVLMDLWRKYESFGHLGGDDANRKLYREIKKASWGRYVKDTGAYYVLDRKSQESQDSEWHPNIESVAVYWCVSGYSRMDAKQLRKKVIENCRDYVAVELASRHTNLFNRHKRELKQIGDRPSRNFMYVNESFRKNQLDVYFSIRYDRNWRKRMRMLNDFVDTLKCVDKETEATDGYFTRIVDRMIARSE